MSWKMFASTITSKAPLALVWIRVRKILGKFSVLLSPIISHNGVMVTNPAEGVSKQDPTAPFENYRCYSDSFGINFTSPGVKLIMSFSLYMSFKWQ